MRCSAVQCPLVACDSRLGGPNCSLEAFLALAPRIGPTQIFKSRQCCAAQRPRPRLRPRPPLALSHETTLAAISRSRNSCRLAHERESGPCLGRYYYWWHWRHWRCCSSEACWLPGLLCVAAPGAPLCAPRAPLKPARRLSAPVPSAGAQISRA